MSFAASVPITFFAASLPRCLYKGHNVLPASPIHDHKRPSKPLIEFPSAAITKTREKMSKPVRSAPGNAGATEKTPTAVKAVVTVTPPISGDLTGKGIHLELVSSELDPASGHEKPTIKGYAYKAEEKDKEVKYKCEFKVEEEFGDVGAVLVQNEHHNEMFLKGIVLYGFPSGPVTLSCQSWVASTSNNPEKRVFFTNKSFLPSETPAGLKRLREDDLKTLRGNGQGERNTYDRIYDYDVYNDLGNPDSNPEEKRPVLGGKKFPYPRRCRTGRPPSKSDPESESTSSTIYVPRDEQFSEVKIETFTAKTVYSNLHALLPDPYRCFTAIDEPYNKGITLPKQQNGTERKLQFKTPEPKRRDSFFWFKDEEFSRQTLAGINPCIIQLVTEWPLMSKLDPSVYGPPESAITTEIIECEIKGFMTVDEAIQRKKLFVLDYHDLLLPYVSKVRQLKGTTLYGSRTLFFLTQDGTLRPVAIELTRPPIDGKPLWRQVFTPAYHSTECWLWWLAKAHVLAHDSGMHQLVSHWLRTHCSVEPYIIATKRQLSAMHPMYRLLHPHLRYTMQINALARTYLINANGIIESNFSTLKYSMELSAVAYDQQWRFDLQALPKDLIHRGMAVEDPTAPHGLKLAIEDYPFANDGLLIWDALRDWVTAYVHHYYSDSSPVGSDTELQSWWEEIRNVGHGDKKDSDGWPELRTASDLIEIVTAIVWVASAHHAAVNFGQYDYASYFPNRPTIARTNMPFEEPTESVTKEFKDKPEATLLKCFPSQIQAIKVMAILDVLSNHSPDEEYLGDCVEPAWEEDPEVRAAFGEFSRRLKEIDRMIDMRNDDTKLKNRNGAGILPYKLLKPFSESGVTGQGVPYSTSI